MNSSLMPEILRSEIDDSVNIGVFSHVIDSKIFKNSRIYKDCWIVSSIMHENTFAGDGTKLDNCILNKFSRSGKYNHLYYVDLGKHTYTGQDTVIMHTKIDSFTSISWGVTIGASEHDFNRLTSHTFLYNSYDKLNGGKVYYDRFEKNTVVGSDVWIGANSTILRGVTVGDGAVIGANTVVTKEVPPYAIMVGNPAKIIKYRFSQDIVERLLRIKWWDMDDEFINKNCDLFAEYPNHNILNKIEANIIRKKGS